MNHIKSGLIIFTFLFFSVKGHAQAGIYSETEIENQSIFMDAQLEKQKGNYEKVIELLKSLIKRDKSLDAAYYELSRAYLAIEDYEGAIKNINKAIAINPEKWYQLHLAEVFEKNEQFQDAAVVFDKLIQQDNSEGYFYQRKAFNELRANKVNDAIATLNAYQANLGVNEEASKRLYKIYRDTGKKEMALSTLQTLVETFPNNPNYLNNLASYQHELGNKKASLLTFQKLLKIDPHNESALLAIERSQNETTGNKDAASVTAIVNNKNISLDNKIKEMMPHLISMTRDGEDATWLDQLSTQLVNDYPNNPKALAVRSDVLFYTGKFKAAEQTYAAAIELDDTKYPLWDQWMLTQWELENYTKLKSVSYDALDYFPNQVHGYLFQYLALKKLELNDEANFILDETKLIAGKNKKFNTLVDICSLWGAAQSQQKIDAKSLEAIDLDFLNNPVFYELLGDIYKYISDTQNAKTMWQKAIDHGANANRILKKGGV